MIVYYKFPTLDGYGFDLVKDQVIQLGDGPIRISMLQKENEYTINWVIYTHEQLKSIAMEELPRYTPEKIPSKFILSFLTGHGQLLEMYSDISITDAANKFFEAYGTYPDGFIEVGEVKKLAKFEFWSIEQNK